MRRVAAIVAVAAVLAGVARAEDLPDQRPMLRIEPGMHTATIRRIGVDAACTLMVTGSEDKTARLWALPAGGRGAPELLRTLRVPIGEGFEGRVNAVALSPDGKWVAAGGWDVGYFGDRRGFSGIYIFEAATGRLVNRLGHLGSAILHLTFSPDGRRLAATTGGDGMRLWETGSWRPIAKDKNYGGKRSLGVAFGANGVYYTVAFDEQIRRYGAGGGLEAKAKTQGGTLPYSIAVHPDGTKLAVGFFDTNAAEVYDARTLKRLYAAETSGISGVELKPVWSADGARLYASGQYWNNGSVALVIWQESGRGRRSEAPLSQNTVMQLLPCGDGMAAGVADPAFGLVAADGSKRVWQEGVTADVRNQQEIFGLSADGKQTRFALKLRSDPVLFDLAAFDLRDAPQAVPGLAAPASSGIAVSDWEENTAPKLNGKPIALKPLEISHALAIAPEASRFVLGTEYFLRVYRADGGELWKKDVPGTAYGVNISGDGKLVVAAYDDGTIRWHRLSDGQELLALFVHAKDRRFIAWTPRGYYAASPGAEDLIGWHVNRDWDHAPDFFPASRFRDQFNRPDIVKRVLGDLDEDTAIAEANRLAGAKAAPEIQKILPPVITISSHREGDTFSGDSLTLRYSVRSPAGLAVSEVSALVDGRPLPAATPKGFVPVSATDESERSMVLTGLPQRDVTLSLVARAANIESVPFIVHLKYRGAPASAAPKGSLYALAVGVAKFKDPQVPALRWAAKDARDFKASLEKQQGRLYAKVEVRLLAGEQADRDAIVDGLEWLTRQVGKDGGKDDVGVLFLSGHGFTTPIGQYYYIPHNARIENVDGKLLPTRSSAVPDSEITETLAALKGKALFFFDTCHAGSAAGSGGLDYNKFVNKIGDAGRAIVLASSAGSELSVELDEWQHGAFTQALLEGLSGQAHHYKNGVVTIGELNLYVERRVEELTGGKPVELKPRATPDFAFASVP
ncbi:MAG: caspase family protein [Rhodomicrobium sp.]